MPSLTWNDDLVLEQPEMDRTHVEFVELLAAAEDALAGPRDALMARFDALHAHTVEHFDQEDRWMAANGFAAENCHASQHAQVLALMREVDRHARELDDLEPMHVLLPELAKWFVQHAQMMDAALAWTMKERGYDPARGGFADPATAAALATAEPISGCGSGACA